MSAEIEYKGYKIIFNEMGDVWNCDVAKPGNSVDAIKSQIDKHIKQESAFPRQIALKEFARSWKNKDKPFISEITVTSAVSDDIGYFWIINESGDRRKERGNVLFLDCPENRDRADQIEKIEAELHTLRAAKDNIMNEMVRFTPHK